MSRIAFGGRATAALAALGIVLACLGLTACGGSSSAPSSGTQLKAAASPPTGTTAAATAPTTATATTATPSASTGAGGASSGAAVARRRRAAVRVVSCMRRNGVDVPEPGPEGYIALKGSTARSSGFQAAEAKCSHVILEAAGVASTEK